MSVSAPPTDYQNPHLRGCLALSDSAGYRLPWSPCPSPFPGGTGRLEAGSWMVCGCPFSEERGQGVKPAVSGKVFAASAAKESKDLPHGVGARRRTDGMRGRGMGDRVE